MSSIVTFPFGDPEHVSHRLVKKLVLHSCQGEFPILPFVGLKPVSQAEASDKDSPLGRMRQRQPIYPEVGIGFYWWMGKERSTEFLGFSPDPSEAVAQHRLSLAHLWRAWILLAEVPFVDVGHDNRTSMLSYCWGAASLGGSPEWMRKISEHFGADSFYRLRSLTITLAESRAARKRSAKLLAPLFKNYRVPYRP